MSLNGIQKPEPKAIYAVGTQPPVDTNSPDTSVNGADSGYTDVCPETSLKELIKSETPLSSAQVAGKLLAMEHSCISPDDITTFINTRPAAELRAKTFAPLLASEAVPEETKSKIANTIGNRLPVIEAMVDSFSRSSGSNDWDPASKALVELNKRGFMLPAQVLIQKLNKEFNGGVMYNGSMIYTSDRLNAPRIHVWISTTLENMDLSGREEQLNKIAAGIAMPNNEATRQHALQTLKTFKKEESQKYSEVVIHYCKTDAYMDEDDTDEGIIMTLDQIASLNQAIITLREVGIPDANKKLREEAGAILQGYIGVEGDDDFRNEAARTLNALVLN